MTLTGRRQDVAELVAALTGWFESYLGCPDVLVDDVAIPSAGFSSETAAFTVSWRKAGVAESTRLVLRHLAQDALFLDDDLWLQYTMMETVAKRGVPVPGLWGHERSDAIIGTPFYLMTFADGRIPSDRPSHHTTGWMTELSPAEVGRLNSNGLAALATINRLDWTTDFEFLRARSGAAPGLESYLDWVERWFRWAAEGRSFPIVERALSYVREHCPAATEVSVLWGDPRLGNLVFDDDLSVSAVLDWEMAALGPAEVDLGWWLMMDWFWSEGLGIARLDGLPTRAQIIDEYSGYLGRPVQHMDYYEILAFLRFGVISVRQVDRRTRAGISPPGTTDPEKNPILKRLGQLLARQVEPSGGRTGNGATR